MHASEMIRERELRIESSCLILYGVGGFEPRNRRHITSRDRRAGPGWRITSRGRCEGSLVAGRLLLQADADALSAQADASGIPG
jgi:hypothetical protein